MLRRSPGSLTRQQLYDLIRKTSKDEYILSEMIRLGFWEEGEDKPSLSSELIAKKGELERELQDLLKQQQAVSDPEKALKELHKQRKKEALEKREITRQQRNEARYQRAKTWYNINQREITFLGSGYSKGLRGSFTDTKRLDGQGLPLLRSGLDLADAMGITINELRFLSFGRKTSKVSHYKQFLIPKKTGGYRRISAPMPRLKRIQYWILDNILAKLPHDESVNGFVPGRSIVTNAHPHIGADIVINMDLKDFFPTIHYKRIKGLFVKLGYSEHVAVILALVCSEPSVDEVELDNATYYVARSPRYLPQGAPTSPAISNLICRRLDKRIKGAVEKLEFSYTRYADDLSFSCAESSAGNLGKLFWRVGQIIEAEGFVIHPDKTRVMRSSKRQEVTGIVVNRKASINRRTLKQFRALLFHIIQDGIEGKTWNKKAATISTIQGFANYVAMVDPEKGGVFQEQAALIKQRHGYQVQHKAVCDLNKKRMREKSAKGEAPKEGWWKAQPPSAPQLEATPEQKNKTPKQASEAAEQAIQEQETERRNNRQDDSQRKGAGPIGSLVRFVNKLFFRRR